MGSSSCSYPAKGLAVVLPGQSPTCYGRAGALCLVVTKPPVQESTPVPQMEMIKLFPGSWAQRLFCGWDYWLVHSAAPLVERCKGGSA